MLKIFALALFVSTASAAWTSCNIPGVLSPDQIVSTHCPNDRCVVSSGAHFYANYFFTPVRVHFELRTRATGYFTGIGPGIPLPMPNHEDACNDLYIGDVLAGCPTEPFVQKNWRIDVEVPAGTPPVANARIRFELLESGVPEFCADVLMEIA